jgi:Ca2+-binding EF-hand superfamily protein
MEIPKVMSSQSDNQVRKRTKEGYLKIFMEFDADNSGSVSKS